MIDHAASGVLPRNLCYEHLTLPVYVIAQDAIIGKFPDVKDFSVQCLISSEYVYGINLEKQGIVLEIFEDHSFAVIEFGKSILNEGSYSNKVG